MTAPATPASVVSAAPEVGRIVSELGLDAVLPGRIELTAALAGQPEPCMLEVVSLQGDTGSPLDWLLDDDAALPGRIAEAVLREVGRLGARPYRLDGLVFAVLGAPSMQASEGALAIQAAVGSIRPALAVDMVHGEAHVPEDAPGDGALRVALARLQARAARRRLSPGRQTRDVLLALLQQWRAGGAPISLPRVASYAVTVGRRLDLGLAELDEVVRAAELLDVGKLVLPEAILTKRGALDEHEWDIVRSHPVIAERVVGSAPALANVARLVRSVGERCDGSGYPDGLRGDEIPLGSRIVAVAVAFDAMTSPRPYRVARTKEQALDELGRCAGHQFDPGVVSAFCAMAAEF